MAGPYPPHQGGYPYAGRPFRYAEPYPEARPVPFPAPPPPPRHPPRRRGRVLAVTLACLAVVGGIVLAAVLAGRDSSAPATAATQLTPEAAKVAIQNYLDALSDEDLPVISRNMLCGLYDGVKDRRTDDALARMSSEAFQKQFARADVTSVDTVVFASPNSAQALFTMKVAHAGGARGDAGVERQAVAQLLVHNNEILVCSYVQRTAGAF